MRIPDPTTSRRDFLKLAAAGGMSLAVPRLASAQAPAPAPITRPVPSSGEPLPVIGLGTARTFNVGSAAVEREGPMEVLRLFVELGGRVIDSSPMYGAAEGVIGEFARALGVGDKLFYATKVWTRGGAAGVAQMRESMRLMGVEKIDLMQIHNLLDWRVHLRTLREWKAQGLVRYIGITHYRNGAFDELASILEREPLDFVQLPYNILNREAERRLLPLARDRRVGVLVNEPFERGSLFARARGRPLPAWAAEFDCASWAQFFLKFIVAHPAVTCPIPATSKPKHLLDNMGAGVGRLPDEATRERMARVADAL